MAPVTDRNPESCALGLDFGTESVRALIVGCQTGSELAEAVVSYPHGVLSEKLPGSEHPLPHEFALQHAGDYLDSVTLAIERVLKLVPAERIIGIGVDFTACTILPIRRDGTPLMLLPEFKDEPHAWVKLWKHHAAQAEADAVNALARERGESFLAYYGGAISSEWMLPKCWEVARKAPSVYRATDLFIDAGDWIVQQMTGALTRNSCAAGYKGLWNSEQGFPSESFLAALDPALAGLRDKWLQNIVAPGSAAGQVTPAFAARTGLLAGTPVSAATIDAHSGVAGMGVYREGAMSIIMGTSSCHMVLSRELKLFAEGYAGVVKDGIIPGFHGYESGQPAVGDGFGWFVRQFLGKGSEGFAELSAKAARLIPGQSGLVALDWLNGNRNILMNSELSGVILGLTLASRPEEVYRALIESTAFGTRMIVDQFNAAGVPIHELVVCGGLVRDPLILQIYADVMQLPVRVAASGQAVALGAAIFGALAAGASRGGFDGIEDAICRMTRPAAQVYPPDPATAETYQKLFKIYHGLHDQLGRENPEWMRELKSLKTRRPTQ